MPPSNPKLRLDDLRADQIQRWVQGERPLVESYLNAHPDLSDEDALILIVGELLLRWERNERPNLTEYQQRLPKYADQIAFQFDLNESLDGESRFDDEEEPSEYVPPKRLPREQILGYVVGPEIGRGPWGIVYQATNESLDRPVALKVLHLDPAGDVKFSAKFVERGRHMAKLDHPNLIRVVEAGRTAQALYVASDICQGVTLAEAFRQPSRKPADLLQCLSGVIQAVAYAHDRGLVLGNIHPGNILLTPDGRVKLTDFVTPPVRQARPYHCPDYSYFPEEPDPTWDIYSLGAILYEILVGQAPGGPAAMPPHRLNPAVSVSWSNLVMRCLEARPERRFTTGAELAAEFQKVFQKEQSNTTTTPALTPPSSRRGLWIILVLVLVFMLGLVARWLWIWLQG